MAVPDVQNPTVPGTTLPVTPRRKRRRAPATGAANDCFTCTHENVGCDRKRPYCTPCLERGKDCAGYKTTLTWGVGVASRGKLRGLSLPIAGSKQQQLARLKTSARKRDSASSELSGRRLSKSGTISGPQQPFPTSPTFSSTANTAPATLSMTWQSALDPVSLPMPSQISTGQSDADNRPSNYTLEDPPYSARSDQSVFSISNRPLEAYNEQGFRSAPETVVPSDPLGCFPTFAALRKPRPYSMNVTNLLQGHDAESSSTQDHRHTNSSSSTPDDSVPPHVSCPFQLTEPRPLSSAQDAPLWSIHCDGQENNGQVKEDEEIEYLDTKPQSRNVSSTAMPINQHSLMLSPFSGANTVGKTPRMKYLIKYYSDVISPVIVAFDGPNNPYRSFILRLASGSETLQHAISALSASNLRQRRESGKLSTGKTDPARRSSLAHLALTDKAWQAVPGFLSVEDQRKEESYHKNATVQLIQRQLADPSQHKDDSVLATLLVICLFHICESGIAKFRTHFAGAKKLLGMREGGSILRSKEAKWFTRMFTWFDAMTATVNDREGQMQDGLLDLSSLLNEDWTLENLAGCDGKLFKIIAKLGHLNILSQNGTGDNVSVPASCALPFTAPSFPDWNQLDGYDWTINDPSEMLPTSTETYPNLNTQYGREWHETRNALLSWMLDTSPFSSCSPDMPSLTQDQQIDLLNISESFRFSALIYMERLALSSVPSSDPRIQFWVRKALYYIQLVRSDVYLLWPLFVTGSECVTDADRDVIRQRCLDIQKDSGFSNNASCLKLLEKIWASSSKARGQFGEPSGFRWRPVMESNMAGGEYIVV